MNTSQARKAARGLSAAADFVRSQLFISKGMAGNKDNLDVPGFSPEALDLALFTVTNQCSAFLASSERQTAGSLLQDVSAARKSLALALLDRCDDGEAMYFMQLGFLAESLRVVQERYGEALLVGAIHQG